MNYLLLTRKISTKTFVISLKIRLRELFKKTILFNGRSETFSPLHTITYYCVRKSVIRQFNLRNFKPRKRRQPYLLGTHSQKFVTASGLHRGRIIKMAARANERVSSFYKDLNYVSNADLLKNWPAEIAKRVFSHRRMKKKRQIL